MSASSSSLSSTRSSRLGSPAISSAASHTPGSSFPDAGDYLRHQLGLPPGTPVNLDCLPDPPLGRKPSQPYPILIKLAIYGNPNKKLTLKGIYDAIENRFEYFKNEGTGAWKRSIRHNLSLNQVFRNTARPITEPGKGSYWELDISQGEGYKRARKRRNKKSQRRQGQESDSDSASADDEECSDSRSESPVRSMPFETENIAFGPSRTVHAGPMTRRSSPYPQIDATQTRVLPPVQPYTAESSRGVHPQAWAGQGPIGQAPQRQYHQPQPYHSLPLPFLASGGQNSQSPPTTISPVPVANPMALQTQMRYPEGPGSVPSKPSYASFVPSASSSMAGYQGHGQLGGPSLQHGYIGALQVPQSVAPEYQRFIQGHTSEEFEGYDTESAMQASMRRGNQGNNSRHHG
ncbi:hypothetical protein AX15_003822 [Amanita polypyramis BW_CC]|nr:hypothetical protein AX15_003822 [Amanita polypyramis BW_CC]